MLVLRNIAQSVVLATMFLGASCTAITPAPPAKSSDHLDDDSAQLAAPKVTGPSEMPTTCHAPTGVTPLDVKTLTALKTESFTAALQIDGQPQGTDFPNKATADSIMCELRAARLVPFTSDISAPMRYDQIYNDCQYRAEVAVDYLVHAHPGLVLGKVFVSGNLNVYGGKVSWGFHVAPYTIYKNDDGTTSIAVLDPAIDAGVTVSLNDWVSAVHGTSDVRVFLAAPTVPGIWMDLDSAHYNRDTHTLPRADTDDAFCADVVNALDKLVKFEKAKKRTIRKWRSVVVSKITDSGLAYFTAGNKEIGPFGVRRDLVDKLKAANKTPLKVCLQPEYGSSWLKNVWQNFSGSDFDVVYSADKPDGQPCPQPRLPACGTPAPQ